jgi:heptosyltransferase-2
MTIPERLKFYRGLKEKNLDLAILLTNSFESALAVYLAGAKNRIGFNRDMRGFLLTDKIPVPSRKSPRIHQAEYYLILIKAIPAARGKGQGVREYFFISLMIFKML